VSERKETALSSDPECRSGGAGAVPGYAILGCFACGISGLVHAFMHESVLGIFAATLAFGAVLFVCFRR